MGVTFEQGQISTVFHLYRQSVRTRQQRLFAICFSAEIAEKWSAGLFNYQHIVAMGHDQVPFANIRFVQNV